MELSYSPSSVSLKIVNQNYKLLSRRKPCNLIPKCSPTMPHSLGVNYEIGRSSTSKNILTKHYKLSSIRACAEPIITKKSCNFGVACWRFLRPYTIKGLALASTCGFTLALLLTCSVVYTSLLARAMIENPNLVEWSLVLKALSGLFALVCVNSFTAGINQIYDVEIDKINKPYLPIAAGDLSMKSALLIVLFCAAAGITVVGFTCSPLITCIYSLALFLGTAYSVPPFRFKEMTLGAILSMSMVMGFLHNFGVYHSLRGTFGLPFAWSAPMIFITTFATITTGVMAIIKDLSDVEGDAKCGVATLATKLGVRNVAYIGCGIMVFYYAASIVASMCMPQVLRCSVIIPMHLISALSLIYQARVLEQENYTKEASLKFYMVLWNLYYVEYMIFPFI